MSKTINDEKDLEKGIKQLDQNGYGRNSHKEDVPLFCYVASFSTSTGSRRMCYFTKGSCVPSIHRKTSSSLQKPSGYLCSNYGLDQSWNPYRITNENKGSFWFFRQAWCHAPESTQKWLKKNILLDLFAGCGGMSLGIEAEKPELKHNTLLWAGSHPLNLKKSLLQYNITEMHPYWTLLMVLWVMHWPFRTTVKSRPQSEYPRRRSPCQDIPIWLQSVVLIQNELLPWHMCRNFRAQYSHHRKCPRCTTR